ncbi:hypothetical protein CPter91_4730 [Collimonas pratensis]|uniref:Uncharacterized protein n=1 Tax=Collimonas pratensis TaxID=279113 RepID=A0A127QAD8_9BURK|nr:hypothetical protein CPter91_4730 [Collimonas pratensis]
MEVSIDSHETSGYENTSTALSITPEKRSTSTYGKTQYRSSQALL